MFKKSTVKITDFGLSKQLEGRALYTSKRKVVIPVYIEIYATKIILQVLVEFSEFQGKLPWKWCSLELLKNMEFSEASDVWAFGVTAWEILSLGEEPYKKGMRFNREFIESLEAGHRLSKPAHASEQM